MSTIVSEYGPRVRRGVGTVDVIGVLAAREDIVKKWQWRRKRTTGSTSISWLAMTDVEFSKEASSRQSGEYRPKPPRSASSRTTHRRTVVGPSYAASLTTRGDTQAFDRLSPASESASTKPNHLISLCARKVVTGPRLMGEKPTSPAKMGVYWWVVITVVILPDTAFPRKVGGSDSLAPGYRLL